jgi:hypothetical protein
MLTANFGNAKISSANRFIAYLNKFLCDEFAFNEVDYKTNIIFAAFCCNFLARFA